jgi:hypothetical protein
VVLGYRYRVRSPFAYRAITVYGLTFQTVQLGAELLTRRDLPLSGPTTPPDNSSGLGYSPFARHYLGNLI